MGMGYMCLFPLCCEISRFLWFSVVTNKILKNSFKEQCLFYFGSRLQRGPWSLDSVSALVGEGRGRERKEKGRKEANRAHPWSPGDLHCLGAKYPTQAFREIIQSVVSVHGVSLLLGFLYFGGGDWTPERICSLFTSDPPAHQNPCLGIHSDMMIALLKWPMVGRGGTVRGIPHLAGFRLLDLLCGFCCLSLSFASQMFQAQLAFPSVGCASTDRFLRSPGACSWR